MDFVMIGFDSDGQGSNKGEYGIMLQDSHLQPNAL